MPGVIIIGKCGVLSRKGNRFHTCLCHRSAVASAYRVMYAAVCLADYTELVKGILKHFFKVGIKAAELPIILNNNFKEIFIGNGVDIDVPCVFKYRLSLMLTGKCDRTAKSRFLAAGNDDADFRVFEFDALIFHCFEDCDAHIAPREVVVCAVGDDHGSIL